MRFSVRSGNARAVDAESNRKILRADVVNDFVVRPLQKRGIYRVIRLQSFRSHCRTQHGGVFFADAYVKRPFRISFEKSAQPQRVRHGGGYGDDPIVFCRKLT